MGDDQRPDAPSLEAPSLGKLLKRRKGRTSAADPAPEQQAPAADRAADPAPDRAADPAAPVEAAPVEAEPATPRADSAPPAPPTAQPPTPPTAQPSAPPTAPPFARPSAEPPAQPPAAAASSPDEDTTVLPPAAAAPPAAARPVVPPAAAVPTPAPAPTSVAAESAPGPVAAEQASAPTRAPRATLTVDGRVATGVTGLVVGLLVVVLTASSLALCESVRGVSSCGGGPGFLLLVLVMAGMVVLGGVMLRLARVPDPTSTSFLAVGLLAVLSLLFLVDVLEKWWMIIVIPLLSAAMFLLSHWVTTQVVDSDA
ncbi:MAG: hypothetical protein F2693_13575 [Actinobacteria bacterium]|nr:hypothetical protein [Actinomycetota bacterium]